MPMLYDFACTDCGFEFEDFTDGSCPACPQCGSDKTERCMSAPWLKTNPMPFKISPPRPKGPQVNRGPYSGAPSCAGNCGSCASNTGSKD